MKKRVLVVDDDDSARFCHARALEQLGCEVVAAEDGAEVPDLVRTRRFDLLVIDLYMPGMNGLEVLRQLRRLRRDLRPEPRTLASVPVLVISGESHAASIANARSVGASDYLVKPVDLALFDRTVRALLHAGATRPAARV